MSYPLAAASLAVSLGELTAARAGAHLAPSPSPGGDEIALHAALTARNEVATLVATIAADVAPRTDRPVEVLGRRGGGIWKATIVEEMRLGRLPIVGAFTTRARELPQIPLRMPGSDPGLSTDPRTDRWISAGQQALVARTEYVRAGDTNTSEAKSWSAVTDAAALATLVTYLDTDLSTSLRGHTLAQPQAAAALQRAREQGPPLAQSARALRAHTSWRRHEPYAATSPEPHQVVRVDSPETLARGQRRLASLITDAVILSPATLYQVINTQERVASIAAAALTDTDTARASIARATATTLGAAATGRAALVTTLASLHREDPAPALQNREIARYLRRMGSGRGLETAAVTGALDATSAVLEAAATSASASTLSGKWLTSDPVQQPAAGPMGAYPWQRAEHGSISPLLTRLRLAASHQSVHAARLPAAAAQARAQRPAHELLRDALTHRPAPPRVRGPQLER